MFMAKLSKQIGREDYMVECMNALIVKSNGKDLEEKEKLLICVAYKLALDKRRQILE